MAARAMPDLAAASPNYSKGGSSARVHSMRAVQEAEVPLTPFPVVKLPVWDESL